MSKIIILGDKGHNVTVGHSYNLKFYDLFSHYTGYELYYPEPTLSTDYKGWRRLFAPIQKIGLIKQFSKGDIIIFGDTTYKYHILLILFCYLFTRYRTCVIVHHFQYLQFTGVKRFFYYSLQKLYYSLISEVIVPSPYTLDIAQRLYPKKNIVYIPLPFQHIYQPSTEYKRGEILYVGTIDRRKGVKYLVKAAKQLKKSGKQFHINIVGKVTDVAYYEEIKEYITNEDLQEYITFFGRVSIDELNKFYAEAELFVLPSLLEGYGIVLIEAFQRGLPIVAFNNSAIPYTVKNGENGFLANNKDYNDLACKIKQILGDITLRLKMQKNIENTIQNLSSEEDFKNALRVFSNRLIVK